MLTVTSQVASPSEPFVACRAGKRLDRLVPTRNCTRFVKMRRPVMLLASMLAVQIAIFEA